MTLKCPHCGSRVNSVQRTYADTVYKIQGKKELTIRRRRKCDACGCGWYTVERNEHDIPELDPEDPET